MKHTSSTLTRTLLASFSFFLRGFLNACLLSIALTFLLAATNVVVSSGTQLLVSL